MSIRLLANQGFSLHNLLGTGDELDVGEPGAADRLFDFRGRLPDQRDHRTDRESELPQGPLRLKVNMSRAETHPRSELQSPVPESKPHRVLMLERQLNEAKERMHMLNQDRTVRVRKAEEQARKALAEERSMRSQLDQMVKSHAQQIAELNRDLQTAEAEAKQLHESYTKIDILQADNQSLTSAHESLTADSILQQETINRQISELTQLTASNQKWEESHRCIKEENDSLVQQLATLAADATRERHESSVASCTSRVELETLKRVNADLNKQIATVTQELAQLRQLQSAAPSDNDSQVDDLMELIEQMRSELAQKDERYKELDLKHQILSQQPPQQPQQPQQPPQQPPQQSPLPTGSISQISFINGEFNAIRSTHVARPTIDSPAFPRLLKGKDLQLMPLCYAPVDGGLNESDSNTDPNMFLKLVIGDFREHIHNTLVYKGAIPREQAA